MVILGEKNTKMCGNYDFEMSFIIKITKHLDLQICTKMGKHKTRSQDEAFVNFMESHADLARGFFQGDRVLKEELWKQLGDELNSCGPPQKSVEEWKKTWLDWKANVKKKIIHNKQQLEKTGGGNFDMIMISNAEEAVARICGLYQSVQGIKGVKSFGAPNKENIKINNTIAIASQKPIRLAASTNHSSSDSLKMSSDILEVSFDDFLEIPCSSKSACPTSVIKTTSVIKPTSTTVPSTTDIEEILTTSPLNFKDNETHSHLFASKDSSPNLTPIPKKRRRNYMSDVSEILDMETENFKFISDKLGILCDHQENINSKLEEITCLKKDLLHELKRHNLVMEKCAAERNEYNQKCLELDTLKYKMMELDKANK